MVKNGLDFLFRNSPSPFRVAAAQCKYICPEWLNWPGTLAGISEEIVKLRNDNFKTRGFSPLIERVLGGVNGTLQETLHSKRPGITKEKLLFLTFPVGF